MPTKPFHPCCTPGCANLTHESRCGICTKGREQRRGSASKRGYGTEHRKRRERVLARDPVCLNCEAQGVTTPSTVYDHIVPIEAGGSVDDMENAQGLCDTCHNAKRAAESRGQQLRIVQGTGFVVAGTLRAM